MIRILESEPDTCFTAAEYMNLYTTTYNMCTQKPPHEYSEQLYERYKRVFKDYLTATVRSLSRQGYCVLETSSGLPTLTLGIGPPARQETRIRLSAFDGAVFRMV